MANDMMKSFLNSSDYTAGQPKKSSEDKKNNWNKMYSLAVAGAMQTLKEKELTERERDLALQQQELLGQMIQLNQLSQALQQVTSSLSPVQNGGGLPPDMASGGGFPPEAMGGGEQIDMGQAPPDMMGGGQGGMF